MKYLLKISIKCPKIEISFDAGKTSKKALACPKVYFFAKRKINRRNSNAESAYSETHIMLGGLLLKTGNIWGYLQKIKN